MKIPEAKTVVRRILKGLSNRSVQYLMEHAANKTPIIHDFRIRATWYVHGEC